MIREIFAGRMFATLNSRDTCFLVDNRENLNVITFLEILAWTLQPLSRFHYFQLFGQQNILGFTSLC